MTQQFNDWFWSKSFWLPPKTTWEDLTSNKYNIRIPQTRDLYVILPLTVLIVLIRMFFERFIALPFLKHCGLKERNGHKAEPNAILEKVYQDLAGKLEEQQVKTLASKLGWTVKRVEQWFRYKQNNSKPSKLTKAKECSWRFFFYTSICTWGFHVLWKEKYLYDTRHFWIAYPNHDLSNGIYYYYIIQLSFYTSLLLSQFADVKRKDFWIQTIHHVVTISLMLFSYSCNFVRVGAVILLVHDVSDVILECGKVCKYLCGVLDIQKFCDVIFGVFAVVFFISRLIIFPWWVLRSVYLEAPISFGGTMPMYYCFMGLLLTLQAMHIFWFYLIARMAYSFLIKGKVENDARSETEESDSGDKNGAIQNGVTNGKHKMQ
ncbi:ceramide synthase 5-like [Dendronephthya gigantea]|uniref:ceramide synthase 5-like n=1 Tax=Dendronephthya gigantea TaxID=151771 RepID=UPI00106D6047|nr:ceramide synthase 5-like [Dendronephthya gigantea]